MRFTSIFLLACAMSCAVAPQVHAQSVRDLSFMTGCWTTPKGAAEELRECFTAPYAGMIQGSSQTVKNGATLSYEFAVISEKNGVITYAPFHMGKALAVFTATRSDESSVTFQNLENDFPKRVIYRRNADRSLTARIEGLRSDDPQNQEWRMVPQGAP